LVCLTRAHGYPSVFLQLAEVVFDQVSPFVGFLVEGCGKLSIGFRRYDWDDVAFQQVISQPIRVESPVSQQMSGGKVADQLIGFAQVMCLSGHQAEINKIAERIGQGQNFRCYASAGTPDGLAKSPPFAP